MYSQVNGCTYCTGCPINSTFCTSYPLSTFGKTRTSFGIFEICLLKRKTSCKTFFFNLCLFHIDIHDPPWDGGKRTRKHLAFTCILTMHVQSRLFFLDKGFFSVPALYGTLGKIIIMLAWLVVFSQRQWAVHLVDTQLDKLIHSGGVLLGISLWRCK